MTELLQGFSIQDLKVVRDACSDVVDQFPGKKLLDIYKDPVALVELGQIVADLSKSPDPVLAKNIPKIVENARLVAQQLETVYNRTSFSEFCDMRGPRPMSSIGIDYDRVTGGSVQAHIQMEKSPRSIDQLKIAVSREFTGLILETGDGLVARALVHYAETLG